VRDLGRGDAGLALLAGDVDLEQDLGLRRPVGRELAQRGLGGDRVDQLGEREDLLDLARLQLADEVPAEVRVKRRLVLELLRAVLAQQRQPGVAQGADLDRYLKLSPAKVVGLMTMPPFSEDPEASRPHFARLAELAAAHGLPQLSMGTSQDYAVAAAEGATIVRIGTSLYT